jgi:hypothetical protein
MGTVTQGSGADLYVGGLPSPREVGLLAMHESDWRRAGVSAYDEAGWTNDTDYASLAAARLRVADWRT